MGTLAVRIERPVDIPEDVFFSAVQDLFENMVAMSPIDTGNFMGSWELHSDGDIALIINDADYASYLDDGWSKQAPDGITDVCLAELPDLFNQYLVKLYPL